MYDWEHNSEGAFINLGVGILYIYKDYVLSDQEGIPIYGFRYAGYRHQKKYKSIKRAKLESLRFMKKAFEFGLQIIANFDINNEVDEPQENQDDWHVSLLGK
jgi:hypothetical protein